CWDGRFRRSTRSSRGRSRLRRGRRGSSRQPWAHRPSSGSTSKSRLLAKDLLELADAVLAADHADGARAAAHHNRLGGGPVSEESDALDQGPIGDPRAGEEDVFSLDQVVLGQDAVEVVAGRDGGLALVVIAGIEPALDDAAEALDCRGGDDPLGRAADA